MNMYRVIIEETVQYQVDVVATSEEEAALTAEDIIVNSEDPNEDFLACTDRQATVVTLL